MRKVITHVVAYVLLLFGASAAPVKVVSFSSVLTEIALAVGGGRVEVVGLVKPGVDPHQYEPSPGDMKLVAAARLILSSGKGLEHFLGKLSAVSDATVVKVGDEFPSLEMEEDGSRVADPHWWH